MAKNETPLCTVSIPTEMILTCVPKTSQRLKAVLSDAKVACQGSALEFVENSIGMLMQAVEIYLNCFVELGIHTRKELENAWMELVCTGKAQDEVEELLAIENEWNSFLKDVDEQLRWSMDIDDVLVGSPGPTTCPLVNAFTGASTSLAEFLHKGPLVLDEFSKYNTQIIIITFGCIEGAKHWKEETGCSFEMLVDEAREIYSAFGLTKSVFKVWNTDSMLYYAEQLAANKPLPKKFGNFQDDIHQMGGDFILNSEGMVVLAHLSRIPTDRPSVDELLQTVKACSLQ